LIDSAHRASKKLAEIAREYRALIVFEDLEKLKENSNNKLQALMGKVFVVL
jgi:IS605 OrfB family transposase